MAVSRADCSADAFVDFAVRMSSQKLPSQAAISTAIRILISDQNCFSQHHGVLVKSPVYHSQCLTEGFKGSPLNLALIMLRGMNLSTSDDKSCRLAVIYIHIYRTKFCIDKNPLHPDIDILAHVHLRKDYSLAKLASIMVQMVSEIVNL